MTVIRRLRDTIGFSGLCVLGALSGTSASAPSVEQFYKTNQLVFLVGHDAGVAMTFTPARWPATW
jgi:hypothetical protein